MFKNGEVFDAKKRLIKLKKRYHGEEGLRRLKEFKEKLNFQELGFSAMEDRLFGLIEKSPDATSEDLENLIGDDIKRFALTKRQTNILFSLFKSCQEKHQAVKRIIAQYLNKRGGIRSRDLFKKFFGRKPGDEIKVVAGPLGIIFCPKDIYDYAYVVSDAFLEGREIDVSDLRVAQKYEALRLEESLVEGFDNIVVIINPIYFDKDVDYLPLTFTLNHEGQHVINGIKVVIHDVEIDRLLDKINRIKKGSGARIPRALKNILIRNYQAESALKDELSAYFRAGLVFQSEYFLPKYVSKALLKKDAVYDFGYYYNKPDGEVKKEFDGKYVKLVISAIIAFFELLKGGHSNKSIQSLLFNEPISKWPRVAERILGKKKSAKRKKRDEKKCISKVIYHK